MRQYAGEICTSANIRGARSGRPQRICAHARRRGSIVVDERTFRAGSPSRKSDRCGVCVPAQLATNPACPTLAFRVCEATTGQWVTSANVLRAAAMKLESPISVALVFLFCSLAGCNGQAAREARQSERMSNFEATQWDFDVIARAALKTIESKGEVTTIVVPEHMGPQALSALRHVHPIVTSAPDVAGTLPAGYFKVTAFTIEDGVARLDGQLGPVTGVMTAANMPDCGRIYSISYYLEGGDWISHAYKTSTCGESRNWTPLDEKVSQPSRKD